LKPVYDRFAQLEGTGEIAMQNAAFLVLHFQNGVAHPDGVWGRNLSPQVRKNNSIANTRSALERARARGMTIIFVNIAYRRDTPELPQKTCGLYRDAKLLNACEIGSWGAAVIDELAPHDGDIEVINYTSDGFEGTALDLILRMKKIDKLYFTGQCIEHVVATTFKRAVNMGYEAVLLSDCTSGFTDQNYEAMLNILPLYGEVTTSQHFIMS
jgi:nicotinamidase-related amidase